MQLISYFASLLRLDQGIFEQLVILLYNSLLK